MRLLPGVHLVGSGEMGLSDSWDCHVYLLDGGDELALIDAGGGRPESFTQIRQNIEDDGLDPDRIRHIILTHWHADHARGAAQWRRELDAPVYLPEIERPMLEGGEAGIVPCPVDIGYHHGETLQVGTKSLRVIQVPGHSPGISALLLEQANRRILFAADIVFLNGLIGLINFDGSEMAPYREHLPRLGGLDIDALLPGHLLFTLRNGQSHIDLALRRMQSGFVPLSIGQLDVLFRAPDDY